MDQASGGRHRSPHQVGAGVCAAAILAVGALTGCGSAHRRPPAGQRSPAVVAPAILPGAWVQAEAPGRPKAPARREAPVAARREAPVAARPKARPAPTWLVNPDRPLPATSPWWPVLAVAHRFATAYTSYEVDEMGPAVRAAIAGTCTSALAAELFAHRAILPPGTTASQVRQRVAALWPLERLSSEARVLATLRSARRGGASGALELRLVPRPGGWRVAAATVP